MKSAVRVAAPPPKPLLIFDGDCNFCKFWIGRWQKMTGAAVDYLPAQDSQIAKRFPEIPCENFAASVLFVETGGAVFFGAEAVLRSLAKNPKRRWPWWLYQKSRIFSACAERVYYFIAEHRVTFSALMNCRR